MQLCTTFTSDSFFFSGGPAKVQVHHSGHLVVVIAFKKRLKTLDFSQSVTAFVMADGKSVLVIVINHIRRLAAMD